MKLGARAGLPRASAQPDEAEDGKDDDDQADDVDDVVHKNLLKNRESGRGNSPPEG